MQSFPENGGNRFRSKSLWYCLCAQHPDLVISIFQMIRFLNTFLKNSLPFFCLTIFISPTAVAQKTNGTVSSLIRMEAYFNQLVEKEGINQAFIDVAGRRGVVFRPNALNIIDFYSKQKPINAKLSWKPELAMISKSGYFGFTTGLYTFEDSLKTHYGHYISVWKAGKNKKWKLELDAGIGHPKPGATILPQFVDPVNYEYSKLLGPKKIKMREDIVYTTDFLFGKSLKETGNKHFKEFYAPDVRLYFPGEQPILGLKNAVAFIDNKNQHVISYPTFTDRAISGDIAYTNGKASIGALKYNYVRIWRIGDDMKWYVIVDMYMKE